MKMLTFWNVNSKIEMRIKVLKMYFQKLQIKRYSSTISKSIKELGNKIAWIIISKLNQIKLKIKLIVKQYDVLENAVNIVNAWIISKIIMEFKVHKVYCLFKTHQQDNKFN